jgi:RNA-binding protein
MAITSKQRSALKSMAQKISPSATFGKGDLTPAQIEMIEQQLSKREIVKCAVLESSPYTAKELCLLLCEATGAEAVLVIGRRFVIYRPAKDPVIRLAD